MMFANPLHSAALAAYPVGSIYMSANATNPGTLFGGTWSQIQGRFLLAADGSHAAGSTGGEATHTLTQAEMPQAFSHFFDFWRYQKRNFGHRRILGRVRPTFYVRRVGIPCCAGKHE